MESLNREWREIIESDLIDPLRSIVKSLETKDISIDVVKSKMDVIRASLDSILYEIREELEYLEEQPWASSEEGEFEDWAEARYGALNEWYEEKSYPLNDFAQRLEAIHEELDIDVKVDNIPKLKEIIYELEYMDIPNRYE